MAKNKKGVEEVVLKPCKSDRLVEKIKKEVISAVGTTHKAQ